MKISTRLLSAVVAPVIGVGMAVSANAAELYLYENSIDFDYHLATGGCLTIGDAISCSAPLINYIEGLDPTAQTDDDPAGYVIPTNQGVLQHHYIVVAASGGAANNSNLEPGPGDVEDGFKTNGGPSSDDYFATGKDGNTAGNALEPDNNGGLTDDQDAAGTWDIDIAWLIDALTFDDGRHDMLIGFDYNEPGNIVDQTLDYWSLITVRDSSDPAREINYEIKDYTGLTYDAFTTTKDFLSKPTADDFSTVNGVTCLDDDGVLPPISQPGGSCPAGYETKITNTNADSKVEFIAILPELNASLEALLLDGYDTISARVLMGCFDNAADPTGTIGVGYLTGDDPTTNCNAGGHPDIFLMGGDLRETVPTPGTLILMSVGLLSVGRFYRRKKVA